MHKIILAALLALSFAGCEDGSSLSSDEKHAASHVTSAHDGLYNVSFYTLEGDCADHLAQEFYVQTSKIYAPLSSSLIVEGGFYSDGVVRGSLVSDDIEPVTFNGTISDGELEGEWFADGGCYGYYVGNFQRGLTVDERYTYKER